MNHPTPTRFPPPGEEALLTSRELAARIREEIGASGGWIGFDRYMERVLYEPVLGYYSGGSTKLGAAGDFVTAPELADAHARALAAWLGPWLSQLGAPAILELGAGTGRLAAQLLAAFAGDRLRYRILEPSPELRQRQRRTLAGFAGRVEWLDRLPEVPFEGIIVANEVLDALPVACFVKRGGTAVPLGVCNLEGGFAWSEGPAQPELAEAVRRLEAQLPAPLAEGYRSEMRLVLPAWIAALGATLARGAVLLIDYGHARRDYYHPERSSGTLICHYRHRAHDDPFLYPGLQDISAWVDFSAAAEAAHAAGFTVAGYTTQAQFLIGALGETLAGRQPSARELAALKTLVLPGEMGERFKVLWLTKDVERLALALPGRDLRSRL